MADIGFLESLGIISVSAAVLVAIGRAVRMPAIVVYLLCGILLGPVFGLVEMEEGLELVSETGIALLLFLVGLELSIGKVKDVGKVALVAGFSQVVLTVLLGFGLSMLLGFGLMEATFLAMALTFSSTVVVVKLLEEKGELESLYGRIGVGVLLVQDLVVIMLLTFLAGMSGAGEAMDAGTIGLGLLKAFGGMAVLLVVALVASKYLLPKPFKWAARSPEVLLVWALSWCFLMVFGAHAFHLSLEIGAFLAGMSLAQLPYNEDLRRRVNPLMNFFVAVFFVTLGIRIDLGGAADQVGAVLALSTFVLIGKPLMFLGILGVLGYGRKTAFLTGTTLAQTSEFSFILAGLAMSKGLIGGEILLVSALVGVVTIGVSSYMIINGHGLYARVLKSGLLRMKFLDGKPAVVDQIVHAGQHFDGHVIVVGMNTLGRELVRRLVAKGENVLAVDTDPNKLENLPGKKLLGSVGYLSVLDESGYQRAKLLVSALQIEEVNDLLAYRCKSVGTPCAIHVVDLSVVENLLDLEADYLMVSKVDGVSAVDPVLWVDGASGGSVQVNVTGSGWLVAWVDWNHDGDFLDSGEMIISQAVNTGASTVAFEIPAGTIGATSESWLSRFRLFASQPAYPLFSYAGVTTDGEVEDHLLEKPVGASIGDLVWNDTNGNGVLDAGEDGLGGITVEIRDSGRNLIATQITSDGSTDVDGDGVIDPAGYYRFRGLAADNYTVTVATPPTGFNPSYDENGTGTPHVTSVALTGITQYLTADFGYAPMLADISGQVRYDSDSNGDFNDPDNGAASVKIQLWTDPNGDGDTTDGVQIGETYTDASGNYIFSDIPTGKYVVKEINPSGSTSTADVSGANDDSIAVTLTGSDVTGRDFLDTPPPLYVISGTVYDDYDLSNDNVIGSGDVPIKDVTITLFLDRDGNGLVSAGDTQLNTTTTSGSGGYSFTGLPAGNYVVQETDPSGATSDWDAQGSPTDNQIGVILSNADQTGRDFLDDIIDTCPDNWAEWKFQNPGQEASGNPDGDANDNLTEFAFAMPANSGAGDAWRIQPSVITPGKLDGVFTRPTGAPDNVVYTLQYASTIADPTVWTSITITPAMYSVVDNGDCTETLTITDLETLTGLTGGKGVVRIKADLDEENDNNVDHTSYTEIEGWKVTEFGICCQTYGTPYLRSTIFTGTVDAGGVSGQVLSFTGSAGSTDLATLLTPGVSYFLEITSGTSEGHRFDIVSATGSTITLANDSVLDSKDAPYNTVIGAPSVDLAGASVVVRRHWTIDEMFPPSGFVATGDQATADQLQLFAGGVWTILYLHDDGGTPRWVDNFNDLVSQGGTVIPPGYGLFFNNRNSAKTLLTYGEIRENDFHRPLGSGHNLVSGGYPINQSVTGTGSRAMTLAANFFGSRDFKTADSFFLWKGDATPGLGTYDTYYQLMNGSALLPSLLRWVKVGDALASPRDAETLFLENRSVFTRSASGLATYGYSSPWAP